MIILFGFVCSAIDHQEKEILDYKISEKDLIDSLYDYIFQNATYFIYHNSTQAVMPSKPTLLMELFVTPLLPNLPPYRLATFVIRVVRFVFTPTVAHPLATIYQKLVDKFCCAIPSLNFSYTFGFTTNFQTSGQFGWAG